MRICGNPVLCHSSEKGRTYRHWNLASDIIRQSAQLVFDCGKCLFCRKKRARELSLRCVLHSSLYKDNMFLTLTYDESRPGYHNNLVYSDIQNFKKRLRRFVDYRHPGRKLDIFNVHEYGKHGKKHWHALVFNYDFNDKEVQGIKNGNTLYTSKQLEKIWSHGYVTIGSVTEASAMYQSQYMEKDIKNGNEKNGWRKSKSTHSGLAGDYFRKHYRQILSLGAVPHRGFLHPVPRYFEKIAHRHYCHYYETSYFIDTLYRRKQYSTLAPGEANKELADLYITYNTRKKERLLEKELKWSSLVEESIKSGVEPDFVYSLENAHYDLKNKTTKENF